MKTCTNVLQILIKSGNEEGGGGGKKYFLKEELAYKRRVDTKNFNRPCGCFTFKMVAPYLCIVARQQHKSSSHTF